jgi:cytochrome c553
VPKIAGQKQAYLERAMHNYAQGLRLSGIMQPVAAALDEEEIRMLAAHYAGLPARTGELAGGSSAAPADQAHRARIDLGRKIATEGIKEELIPPCLACHRNAGSPLFPRLVGQHAAYLSGQLRLWKNGLRAQTPPGRIMAAVATRLSDEQIAAVAAYFEELAPLHPPEAGSPKEEHR